MNALNLITKTASCSAMGDYALKHKLTVPYSKAKKGDIVLYDFNHNGTSDHVGIIYSTDGGKIYVVEGNTSTGNDCNGGCVMKRSRVKSNVNYIVRPKYTKEVTADMIVDTALAEVGVKENPKNSNNVKYNTWFYGHAVKGSAYPWCMAFVCWVFAHVQEPVAPVTKPTGKYSGTIPAPTLVNGDKGDKVKALQNFLNWYHPAWKLSVDGGFGSNTLNAVRVFQTTEGISADGVYGKQSEAKAKAYKASTPTPTPSKPMGKYSGTIPSPTLKKGSKGTSVKNLQKFLNWYGNFKLSVDGGFGDKTLNALKAFQKAEGISADGIYGKKSESKAKAYKASAPKPTPTPTAGTNAQKIVNMANELAWAYGTSSSKWDYKKGNPTAKCKSAMNSYGYKTRAKMSSCIYAVNTVVRKTGINKSFCAGHGYKKPYPKTESGFNTVLSGKAIPSGFLKAGDVVRYKKTSKDEHTLIYMGNNRVAEARHYHRFFNIYKDEKRYNGSNVKKSTLQVLRAKE